MIKIKTGENTITLFLRNEYKSVFSLFDKKIYIQSPSFKYVLKWRYAQEKSNASKSNNKNL